MRDLAEENLGWWTDKHTIRHNYPNHDDPDLDVRTLH
jgi:hypothetical protein